MSPGDEPTVLVVDDDEPVADAYRARLDDHFETMVAYSGKAALEAVTEAVDVVLLDRRMPDCAGDEVLADIRARGLECHVIMVTAVDPDFDILALPCDDYLCKPVTGQELLNAIDRQLEVASYDERLREFVSLNRKLHLLEDEKGKRELAAADEIVSIKCRLAELETDLIDAIGNGDDPTEVLQQFV